MGGSVASVTRALDRVVPRHVAPGQPHTLIGLVGRGIQSSRTPRMHELEGARLGLFYNYVLVDFDQLGLPDHDLGAILKSARARGFAGLNVTHPFKQAVIAHLDALAPEAEAIGAVNTIVFGGSGAVGHNTDSWGFAESFREGMADAPLQRIVQFGAGGAGAAVAYALRELGAGELSVIDTDGARATALCAAMATRFPGRIREETGCRWPGERHAGRHGEVSRPAFSGKPALAPALGCRDRLFPGGNRTSGGGPGTRLPHLAGHRHGHLPGRARV